MVFGRVFLLLVLVSHFTGALLPLLVFSWCVLPFYLGRRALVTPLSFGFRKSYLVWWALERLDLRREESGLRRVFREMLVRSMAVSVVGGKASIVDDDKHTLY